MNIWEKVKTLNVVVTFVKIRGKRWKLWW